MTDPSPNALERALARAVHDEQYRPEFCRVLLESDVYVLGHTEGGGDGSRTLQQGEQVSIAGGTDPDGTRTIAFFSSAEALSRAITEPQRYLRLPARALFEMTRGARLTLNPGGADYGKEFPPHEVERLLRGEDPAAPGIDPVTIQRETQVLLGQPAEYPHAFVQTLKQLFAGIPPVRAAYLAQCAYPDEPGDPHLLVGIDAGDGYRAVMDQLGRHAGALRDTGRVIDFVPMDAASPLASYLAGTKPFYTRGPGARLRSFLGG